MLIDLHAHSSGISRCCKIPAPKVLEISRDLGLDGIVLTNHYQKSYVKDGTPREFEAHRKFLDIHYVIDGVECMGYADIDTLTPTTEYNDEKDYQMLKGHVNKIILNKGDFCVVFPEDAHLPQMIGDDGKWVKKAVVKMKV